METATVLSIIAITLTSIGLVVNLAKLKEDEWETIRRWGRSAAKAAHYLYCVVALLNGSAGVLLFAVSPGMPNRLDILKLVLFLSNIAIGVWQFNEAAKTKALSKADASNP